jgi:pyruvate formate lyase activating enzyme
MIKEASLYQKINDKVQCRTCQRFCKILPDHVGFCKTRKNISGKLFTLAYGEISSISANPIEKKPFFHFWLGSRALTVGTWSCNFTCPWCQNYRISKYPQNIGMGKYLSPEKFIDLLKKYHCQGTSISFNEPTLLLEYSLDLFPLAKKEGFYNTFVTNGYMSSEALKLLIENGLDAMNVDLKGNAEAVKKYCSADVEKVWQNITEAKELGVHVEITTLIIPGVNDDEVTLRAIATRIKGEVGPDTPWHVTQYYPAYRALEIGLYPDRTPVETIEKAWKIGKECGLHYVYVGNIPGHPSENTYCPNCQKLLIERYGFDVIRYLLTSDKRCPKCQKGIPIIGQYVKKKEKGAGHNFEQEE